MPPGPGLTTPAPQLPLGEGLLGTQTLVRHRLRKPVRWKRPRAFRGVRKQRPRRRAFSLLWWSELILDPLDLLFDLLFERPSRRYVRAPLARAFRRLKDSNALIARARRTEADRLVCAMSPRCRVRPRLELQYTDHRLRLLYVYAPALATEDVHLTEVGWETPTTRLAWLRPRRDGPKCLYEFGFTDGSWISLELVRGQQEEQWREFVALVPSHLHLPAGENPSRGIARSLRREWRSGSGGGR